MGENPGVSQVKLIHFLLRILCSYYGKDTLKENLLSFLGAKNTRVQQAIGVSIPSAHCSEDDQNCLKEIESSVQKVVICKRQIQAGPNLPQAIYRFARMSAKTTC